MRDRRAGGGVLRGAIDGVAGGVGRRAARACVTTTEIGERSYLNSTTGSVCAGASNLFECTVYLYAIVSYGLSAWRSTLVTTLR